jgi:hypothetical protein
MRALRTTWLAGLCLFTACIGFGQAPAIEELKVAAVKQFTPNGAFPLRTIGRPGTSDPGRITQHLLIENLLMSAYRVQRCHISGLPGWGTIRPGATKQQVRRRSGICWRIASS